MNQDLDDLSITVEKVEKKHEKLDLLKSLAGFIVSMGVGAVVGNAIKASTPTDIRRFSKITYAVGGFVLSNMVGDFASRYVSDQIDEVAENIQTTFNPTEDDTE
jgi:uncharacterized membrane protein